MENKWFAQKNHVVLVGTLSILAYFLLMFGNGIVSLSHPDEVFYIQSAKEMIAQQSWLTPIIFDEPHFEKPFLPFVFFIIALEWLGMTAFAGRFFPALFGITGVLLVYWIAWLLFKNKRTSFLSGVILSSSFIYVALSRAVLTDMIFSVFITAAMGFFCLAYYNRKFKKTGIMLFWVFAAIAVLTKGLLGIIFPSAVIFIFLVYKKETSFLKNSATVWGFFLFLVIALPWHILMYLQHGQLFLEEYFYNVHWRRVLMSEHPRLDNWYFYFALLFVGVVPWFLMWIPSFNCIYKQFKRKLTDRSELFFLLSWIFGVYIFVQPAHSKLASYIFPVFFAVAILLAYAVNEIIEKAEHGGDARLLTIGAHIMSVFLIALAVAGIPAARHYIDVIVDMRYIYLASGMFTAVALLIFMFNQKKLYTQMVFSHLGVTVALIVSLYFARPYIEPWVSCKNISEMFLQRVKETDFVLTSKFYLRGVRYYTDLPTTVIDLNGHGFWSPHPIPFLYKDHEALALFMNRPVTWAILKDGNVRDIYRLQKIDPSFTIERFEETGGKFILKISKKQVE